MKLRSAGRLCVATVLALSGIAPAQAPKIDSPDGGPLWKEWRLSSLDKLALGGRGSPSSLDLTPTFIPCGQDPEADSHSAVSYLPDGSAIVVANRASRNLTVFNPNTRALIRNIPLSGSPQSLAISPNGARAVTANLFEGTASIVDLVNGVELGTVPVGSNPATARITPGGATAIIHNNGGGGSISVIDIASGSVLRTIPTGGVQTTFAINFESQGVGLHSTGPALYDETTAIFPDYSGRLLVIDLSTGATTAIPCAATPTGVAIRGTKAYITHYNTVHIVTELDVPSRTITRTFNSTADLQGPIAVNGAGTKAAVAVLNSTQMLDLVSGTFTGNLGPLSNPNDILTTADGNSAVIVGFYGTILSYATNADLGDVNQFVSCSIGAVSPTSPQAVTFSDTFGEDMVVMSTGPSPARLSAGPTGPVPEADKCRVAAVTPDGSKAIVVNQFSQTATIINTATHAVLAIVPIDRRAGDVAITPDGSKAVVASRDGTNASVINLSTFAVSNVAISTRADQVRISPDSQFAYLAVVVGDGVWRINLNTLAVQGAEIPTGNMGSYFQQYNAFSGIALSPDGSTLITCDSFDQQISIIDTAAWTRTQTVPVGASHFPVRAVFSGNSRLYVSNRDSDSISILDKTGGTWLLTGSITTGDSPTELTVSPEGSRLYTIITGTNPGVAVLNTATQSQTTLIAFAANPTIDGIALSPDGSRLYISHSNGAYAIGGGGFTITQSEILSVVDTSTNAVIDTMNAPDLASGLAIAANGSVLAMPNLMSEGATLVPLITPPACYPNCDGSTTAPILNVLDFGCFLNRFAAGDTYANCDHSTTPPILNVLDFGCFLNSFAAGCT